MTLNTPQTVELERRTRNINTLLRLAYAEFGLLGPQFVLGMILNLFVTLPSDGSLSGISASSLTVLVLHIILAFVIVAVAIAMIVISVRTGSRAAVSGSLIVALGVITSFVSGRVFLSGQDNIDSLIMAMGFLVATVGAGMIHATLRK
jgi:hypothetical protein